jgi:hypothetical protein
VLTLILIPIAFVLVAVGAWLLTRDTTAKPPPPPGRHRRTARDPHDPIRDDDQEPPEQGL